MRPRHLRHLVVSLVVISTAFSSGAWARKPMHPPMSGAHAMCIPDFTGVTGNIKYLGGAVMANVHAIPVFWTANVDPAIQAWAEGYLATLANSAYMDLLAEYSTVGLAGGSNQKIGRGTAGPGVVITPSKAAKTINDANNQIATELEAQITAGKLPAPVMDDQGNPNTLYVVFFPPGTVVNDGTGDSCADFCAYHSAGGRNSNIIYAMIPDMGPSSGCSMGCSDSCSTTITEKSVGSVSHEFAEAISDPVNGWYNEKNPGIEIGDICTATSPDQETDTAIVPGTNIKAQLEWSQKNGKCLLAPIGFDGGTPPVVDSGVRDARPDSPEVDSGPGRDAGTAGVGNGGSGGATGSGGSGVAGGGSGAGGASSGTGGGMAGATRGSGGIAVVGPSERHPSPGAATAGGCSCKVGGGQRAAETWSALLLLALSGRKRRRRV